MLIITFLKGVMLNFKNCQHENRHKKEDLNAIDFFSEFKQWENVSKGLFCFALSLICAVY